MFIVTFHTFILSTDAFLSLVTNINGRILFWPQAALLGIGVLLCSSNVLHQIGFIGHNYAVHSMKVMLFKRLRCCNAGPNCHSVYSKLDTNMIMNLRASMRANLKNMWYVVFPSAPELWEKEDLHATHRRIEYTCGSPLFLPWCFQRHCYPKNHRGGCGRSPRLFYGLLYLGCLRELTKWHRSGLHYSSRSRQQKQSCKVGDSQWFYT